MKNIKIMRLQTGEDIIGEVEEGEVVSIKKPFTIIPMQSQPGKPVQLVLTPWMPYTDDRTLTIDCSKVITIATPKPDILKSYEHNISEIITSKPGLITETNLPKL
tara:strand:+ start:743 stop:1057 length:315 start_codon:yes stop_codon:yes gene_type:complete